MTAAGEPARPPARAPRRRWLVAALAGLAALAVAAAVLLLQRPAGEGPEELPPVAGDYPFGDGSVWRQDVRDAPLHEDSAAMVEHLVEQVEAHYGGVAAFNVNDYSTSSYVVDADQPRVDVAFEDCQDKGHTPSGVEEQFSGVPVPDDAVPAAGRDGQLTVWSPDTDQLWEFWRAERVDGQWRACWGGRIDDVSTSPGFFEGGFGSSASGLAVSGGMVRVDDVRAGAVEHALALQIVSPATWKRVSWPAQRSDGFSTDEHALPEGQRLRLDPDLDLDALDLHPVARMVAEAAQRYGFLVVDKAGSVAVSAETGQATGGALNPWDEVLDGTPSYEVMAGFPWRDLQVLPTDYGKP
ncbi:DUF4124 domain-containing protein [Kineococcus terrestris]|uniref:DUF4124 domain-containing protein n=1 Tax=Kineococcus terrestris TaxID=2044856 RepID=UPI0034DACD13